MEKVIAFSQSSTNISYGPNSIDGAASAMLTYDGFEYDIREEGGEFKLFVSRNSAARSSVRNKTNSFCYSWSGGTEKEARKYAEKLNQLEKINMKKLKFKQFSSAEDVIQFAMSEIIATLQDDLDRMQNSEREHYSKHDRENMKNKISDIKKVESLANHAPALFYAGINVVKNWEKGNLAGAVNELRQIMGEI